MIGAIPVPQTLLKTLPPTQKGNEIIRTARNDISHLLHEAPSHRRLLVVIGPCSIHDPESALDYGNRLLKLKARYQKELLIIMRSYVEKPRTTIGWKGLVNDPDLDDSCDIPKGVYIARELMTQLTDLGLPVASELLSPLVEPYLEDLLSIGFIGARTTESQLHREMVSALPFPVGFKNGTDSSLTVAMDAIVAARASHTFLATDRYGGTGITKSAGNPDCFAVLRGGSNGPNYHAEQVLEMTRMLDDKGIPPRLVIDCSHGNSQKDYRKQVDVASEVAEQIRDTGSVVGVMLESHLQPGRQNLSTDGVSDLEYGVSITDGCIGWDSTEEVLELLASAVRTRQLRLDEALASEPRTNGVA